MTDNTEFFHKCINIYAEGRQSSPLASQVNITKVKDTFNNECKQLYTEIVELERFARSVRENYLLSGNTVREYDDEDDENAISGTGSDDEGNSRSLSAAFTEEDRDLFDTRSKILLHKFKQKLAHIESYETERSKNMWFSEEVNGVSKASSAFETMRSFVQFTLNKEEYHIVNEQVHAHRKGVLSSLMLLLKRVSQELGDMQSIRLNRKLEERSSELHTVSLSYNEELQMNNNDSAQINDNDNFKEYERAMSELAPQQLQQLQHENSQLLDHKLSELSKVKNLQKSTSEITNLQRELALHVEAQAAQIARLEDDHETSELYVAKGNKELRGAKRRGRKASTMVVYASVVLGFMVLFFDAVIV